jgi:hypothetical protein
MSPKKAGKKGFKTEELLRSYFLGAGFFAVRGVPFRQDGQDQTDIDIWLYERSAMLARRRIFIDVKDNANPRAAERLFFIKGLAELLGAEAAGIVTSDSRGSLKDLAKRNGVLWIDNADLQRLKASHKINPAARLSDEELAVEIADADRARSSTTIRDQVAHLKSSLATRFGSSSGNIAIECFAFFSRLSIQAHPGSRSALLGTRLSYLAAAIAAASFDFVSGDTALRQNSERVKAISEALQYGSDPVGTKDKLKWAEAAAREFLENGAAVAEAIRRRFTAAIETPGAEHLAQIIVKNTSSDALFEVARALEAQTYGVSVLPFDKLQVELKSWIGALIDYCELDRREFALAANGNGIVGQTTTEKTVPESPNKLL